MSVFDNLVDAARDFACGLYKNQPGALIPNPGEAVLRFAWDKLCDYPDSPGLPPPPASPFTGGQCDAIPYVVRVSVNVVDQSGETPFDLGNHVVFGPVSGVGVIGQRVVIYCRGASGVFPQPPGYPQQIYQVGGASSLNSPRITAINRQDGAPDNCGDPPISYPPGTVPPGGFNSPPVPVPLADGDNITVNFNFSPPAASLDKIPPIIINYVKPEINLKVPIEFNFNGEIDIGVPSNPPVVLPPDVINNINNINNNTNQTNNNFNDYRKDYDFFYSPPKLDDDSETVKEDDFVESGKEENKEGIVGLRIELTKLPDKAQFGSPTVYFAGWAAFKRDEGYMPREQINFADSFFLAPPGATGYTVTFTNGAEGNIRVYSKVNESQ